MFSRSGNPIILLRIMSQVWKKKKSKPEVDMKLRISRLLYMNETKFQRICPCFRGWVIRLDYSEECSKCGKERNQRWRQNEETSLITDQCLVQQEVLYGAYLKCKYDATYIFTNEKNQKLYRASRKNSISITDKIGIPYIIYFPSWPPSC